MPKVSVIIPAHNAEQYIEKCLLSLKDQTFNDFEVIVVDDGSLDKTYEIAAKYTKVIKSTKNLGEGAARNLGAKEAAGEILAFSDVDVIVPKDWLKNILNDMQIHNVQCVGGGYAGSVGSSFMEMFAHWELTYRRKQMPEFVSSIVSNNFACCRDVFFEFGGFPERFKCEDLRLSFLISKKYKIFWDEANGVYHHYKTALKDYLRQQFYFSRDTVWSYYQYPGMFKRRTHQGTSIYYETILMFLTLISLIVYPLTSLLFLALLVIMIYHFLAFLKNKGLPVVPSSLVIIIRDVICVIGIFAGVGLCFKNMIARIKGAG